MKNFALCALLTWLCAALVCAVPFLDLDNEPTDVEKGRSISRKLFYELEELARIVDISYCVGTTGIQKPFTCAGRCSEFEGFELVKTWHTGLLMSDSCGYIAISHPPWPKRIILSFRGTYSIANTIADLSTVPQEYIPYPTDGDEDEEKYYQDFKSQNPFSHIGKRSDDRDAKCNNCTVHAGFLRSWLNTRDAIMADVLESLTQYPDYELVLVGHSLGGAVAGLAALELQGRGLNPHVTTFGEPRMGNLALMKYFDARFSLNDDDSDGNGTTESSTSPLYRRITHINDPVPLLPLEEWGYHMHAGEIFISKLDLSPDIDDLRRCFGDEDETCIQGPKDDDGADATDLRTIIPALTQHTRTQLQALLGGVDASSETADDVALNTLSPSRILPPRYRLWELFFAHRDYFWRLGLCVPGGDPKDWWRVYPPRDGNQEKEKKPE